MRAAAAEADRLGAAKAAAERASVSGQKSQAEAERLLEQRKTEVKKPGHSP